MKTAGVFLVLVVAFSVAIAEKKIVCYFENWSIYRPGDGKFAIENIDPNLCTHIIYAFVGLNPNGSINVLDSWADIDLGGFRKVNELKLINPKLKTSVAIGGWNEGSVKYSEVVSDPQLRKTFVRNAVNFVKDHGFDGFDLDWEYPARRGGAETDKANFGLLVKELRHEFDQYGFLLSAAVSATASSIEISYDVSTLSKNLDFINIMAYDFHSGFDPTTGQNAPLFPSSQDINETLKELNVAASIRAWINAGAPPHKLVLGTPAYGKSFTLRDPAVNGIGAPASGPGAVGPYTGESGILSYYEICSALKSGNWTYVWSHQQQVPYIYSGNQWIGYDNPKSIGLKVQLGKIYNLGGYMVWALGVEDFRGDCGSKYPLISTIKSLL